MYDFHETGFPTGIDPSSKLAAIVRLALCSSHAAYAGTQEAGTPTTRNANVGDSVIFFRGGGAGVDDEEVPMHGTVTELHFDSGMARIRGVDERFHEVSCGYVYVLCTPSTHAAVEALCPHRTGAQRVMWSDGYSEADPTAAGYCHPHLIVQAKIGEYETLVVACRGSVTSADWKSDLSAKLASRPAQDWESNVHGGFLRRAETIPVEPILDHLRGGGRVMFTGHSLGSAVAEVLCIKVVQHIVRREHALVSALLDRVVFIGFACPVVCTEALGEALRGVYGHLFHHVQTEHDIVPMLSHMAAVSESWGPGVSAVVGGISTAAASLLPPPLRIAAKVGLRTVPWLATQLWNEVAPNLSKGYGWWYCATSGGIVAILLRSAADVKTYRTREMRRIAELGPQKLSAGISQHSLQDYMTYFERILGQRSDGRCVASRIFSVDESTVSVVGCARYSRERSTLRVTINSPIPDSPISYVSGSPLVNIARATVSFQGKEIHSESKTRCPYVSITSNPHDRYITFHLPTAFVDGLADNPLATVKLTLQSVYADAAGLQTLTTTVGVESEADDTHVVDTLRGCFFIALTREAGGVGHMTDFAQHLFRELEYIAAERVFVDSFEEWGVVHLPTRLIGKDATLCIIPRGSKTTRRVHFIRLGDTYLIVDAARGSYLSCPGKPTATSKVAATWTDESQAAPVQLSITAGGIWRIKHTEFTLSTSWSRWGFGDDNSMCWLGAEFEGGRPDFDIAHGDNPEVRVAPALHGYRTVCSRLLVGRYLASGHQHEGAVRRQMIMNSQEYIYALATTNPTEHSQCQSSITSEGRLYATLLPSVVEVNPRLASQRSLQEVIAELRCGLPPAVPLSVLFEEWNKMSNAVPPLTRFYFAGLSVLLDVALTVCSCVSSKLTVKTVGWLEWMRSLGKATDSQTTLSAEYIIRLYFVVSLLKSSDPAMADLQSRVASAQQRTTTPEDEQRFLRQRYPLPVIEAMLLKFEDSHQESTPERSCGSLWTKFRDKLNGGADMPDSTVRSLHFVYRLMVCIARLNRDVRGRCHLAAVFGPQQTGKTTLLELLVQPKNLPATVRDAHGHTKEPILLSTRVVRPPQPGGGQTPPECHIVCDLPGATDGSATGDEIRSLQLQILTLVRALIVIQPLDSLTHNQQRIDLLSHVPPSARCAVLMVRANVRFTQLKNVTAREGLPVPLVDVGGGEVAFEWEGETYRGQPPQKYADCQKAEFSAGETPTLKFTVDGRESMVPLRRCEAMQGNGVMIKIVDAPTTALAPGIPPAAAETLRNAIRSKQWDRLRELWKLHPFPQGIAPELVERLIVAEDKHALIDIVKDCTATTAAVPKISFWRAEKIWRIICVEASENRDALINELRTILTHVTPHSFQYYVPALPQTDFYADFDSEKSALGRDMSKTVRLSGNSAILREDDQRALGAPDEGHFPPVMLATWRARAPELAALVHDVFQQSSLRLVLNQEDVRSFLATTHALGDCNSELLKCLQLDERNS